MPAPSAPERTLTVSNQDLVFLFTSYGGGLKSVALRNYPAVVSRPLGAPGQDNYATLNTNAAAPILAVLGAETQGDNDFTLTQSNTTQSNTTVRADMTLPNGLRLVKEFQIGNSGTNFLFTATLRFVNSSSNPMVLSRREVVVGSATPIGPLDDPTAQGTIWYNGNKAVDIGASWFANRTMGCFPGTPRTLFEDGASNVVWAASHSQFFALAAIPAQPAPGISIHQISLPAPGTNGMPLTNGYSAFSTNEIKDWSGVIVRWRRQTDRVSKFLWGSLSEADQLLLMNYQPSSPLSTETQDVVVECLNKLIGGRCIYEAERFQGIQLRPETTELLEQSMGGHNLPHLNHLLLEDAYPLEFSRNPITGYETAFDYPAATLGPGKSWDQSFTFYAGPKEYNGLAVIGDYMGNKLDLIMGFTGFLGFGFFSKILLISMTTLHKILPQYGLCIIAITVIVKLIFWPMTAASTRSQKRLQTLQPQLKAIAEKYKDDPLKKHEKTSAFMKEHKVNPMGSCLPMLIQLPVFYGFYSMLRSAIELRGTHFLWASDLTQPDTICHISGFPINPLPLVMGVTQLWQSHLTPVQPGMDPAQQKLMRFMPVLFIAFFYRMSAGLTLYWTISTLLTIAQTKMTRTVPEPNAPAAPAPRKKK
jgi:YidC/Oxa1 family membrane protein insertase